MIRLISTNKTKPWKKDKKQKQINILDNVQSMSPLS